MATQNMLVFSSSAFILAVSSLAVLLLSAHPAAQTPITWLAPTVLIANDNAADTGVSNYCLGFDSSNPFDSVSGSGSML